MVLMNCPNLSATRQKTEKLTSNSNLFISAGAYNEMKRFQLDVRGVHRKILYLGWYVIYLGIVRK